MQDRKGFLGLFGVQKPILGMLHLKGENRDDMLARARLETQQMIENGVNAVIVENYFGSLEDVECVLQHFHRENVDFIYGVNALHNDELGFRLAREYGASFLQLDSVAGHLAPEEDEGFGAFMAAQREVYDGFVLGGVRFKYQPYNSGRSLSEDLSIGAGRCDAVVVTGTATGEETSMDKIREFRGILGDFPLVVGAGMTPQNCAEQFGIADAAIVGSYFKAEYVDSGDVDPGHVKAFMEAVEACRQG